MNPVSVFLLVVAAIFVIGVLGEWIFTRTGIPDVIWLIVAGLLIGPVGGLVSREALLGIAPYFGAVTLVMVLFEGGSQLPLRDLSAAAARASLLALMSFSCSVIVVATASMLAVWIGILPQGWTWMHGLTTGAILGGSSSVVIMPAMTKARLAPRIAHLVSLESALTDVLCVVGTVACIGLAADGATDLGVAFSRLWQAFGTGFGVGLLAGLVGLLFLKLLRNTVYAYPLTLGGLLSLYVLVDELQGSAPLAILTVAVILGNAPELRAAFGLGRDSQLQEGVRVVHSQLTFFIKSFFFTFIGAMLGPPWWWLGLGAVLGVLLLGARAVATMVATLRAQFSTGARRVIAVTLPRGMAAGVLAMFPHQSGLPHTEELPVLVFAAVLCTIVIFAVALPVVRRSLGPEDLLSPGGPPPMTPESLVPPPSEPVRTAEPEPGGPAPAVGGPVAAPGAFGQPAQSVAEPASGVTPTALETAERSS